MFTGIDAASPTPLVIKSIHNKAGRLLTDGAWWLADDNVGGFDYTAECSVFLPLLLLSSGVFILSSRR